MCNICYLYGNVRTSAQQWRLGKCRAKLNDLFRRCVNTSARHPRYTYMWSKHHRSYLGHSSFTCCSRGFSGTCMAKPHVLHCTLTAHGKHCQEEGGKWKSQPETVTRPCSCQRSQSEVMKDRRAADVVIGYFNANTTNGVSFCYTCHVCQSFSSPVSQLQVPTAGGQWMWLKPCHFFPLDPISFYRWAHVWFDLHFAHIGTQLGHKTTFLIPAHFQSDLFK